MAEKERKLCTGSQSFGLEMTQVNSAHRPLASISHLALPNYIGAEKWGEDS